MCFASTQKITSQTFGISVRYVGIYIFILILILPFFLFFSPCSSLQDKNKNIFFRSIYNHYVCSYSSINAFFNITNIWSIMGTKARNLPSTPCWALERLFRGLSDRDACLCNGGKRRVAGYVHESCIIPGTNRVRSQFLSKIIGTLLSTEGVDVDGTVWLKSWPIMGDVWTL